MKVLVLAGEESGQIYARRIREMLPGHEVRGYDDYGFKTADLAVMGFVAVLRRIRYFLNVKAIMERAILEWRPDVVCTIDYPGMNLKLAAFAKAHGIRTVHVVCPQVWAWKSGRIPKIEASVDRLCCFLPFEPAMFRPGFAEFVGHPLAEEFAASARDGRAARAEFPHPLVAVLPGSRIGEIERNFPTMLEAVGRLGKVHAVVPAANEEAKARIEGLLAESGGGAPARRVVLFSCDRALAETLSMRMVTATLVAESRSGLRIPKQALYTEMTDSGEVRSYVFVRTGVKAEKKYVEILYEADSFFLAATGTESASLREGNEIIVSAKDLYDGKIME